MLLGKHNIMSFRVRWKLVPIKHSPSATKMLCNFVVAKFSNRQSQNILLQRSLCRNQKEIFLIYILVHYKKTPKENENSTNQLI